MINRTLHLPVPSKENMPVPISEPMPVPSKENMPVPISEPMSVPSIENMPDPKQETYVIPKQDTYASPKASNMCQSQERNQMPVTNNESMSVPSNEPMVIMVDNDYNLFSRLMSFTFRPCVVPFYMFNSSILNLSFEIGFAQHRKLYCYL